MSIHQSPTLWVILIIASIAAGAATAEVMGPDTPYQKPPDLQWNDSRCHEYMVDMLRRATDPSDPQQQGYLLAAEAYQKLQESYQRC